MIAMPNPTTHENKCLYLHAPRGYYIIHPNGNVERTDMAFTPSGQWKMVGLVHRNAHSLANMIPLSQITPEWVNGHRLADYRVVDWDHGTYRSWGDKTLSISFWTPETIKPFRYQGKQYA